MALALSLPAVLGQFHLVPSNPHGTGGLPGLLGYAVAGKALGAAIFPCFSGAGCAILAGHFHLVSAGSDPLP